MPETFPNNPGKPHPVLRGARAVLNFDGRIVGMESPAFEVSYEPATVLPDHYRIKRIEQDLKDPSVFVVHGEYTPQYPFRMVDLNFHIPEDWVERPLNFNHYPGDGCPEHPAESAPW